MTLGAVGNWEQGQAIPRTVSAALICAQFDLTLDYLFLGKKHTLKVGVAQQIEKAEGEL